VGIIIITSAFGVPCGHSASLARTFAEKSRALGIDAKGNTPAELDDWTPAQIARWAEVAKAADIKADQGVDACGLFGTGLLGRY
jgi:hypothetical protein